MKNSVFFSLFLLLVLFFAASCVRDPDIRGVRKSADEFLSALAEEDESVLNSLSPEFQRLVPAQKEAYFAALPKGLPEKVTINQIRTIVRGQSYEAVINPVLLALEKAPDSETGWRIQVSFIQQRTYDIIPAGE